jgi:hypothetical protein
MRRLGLLLLLGLVVAGGYLLVQYLRTPATTITEAPPPPPAAPRGPPLQAEAEGSYVPGYRFTVANFRFAGFELRPQQRVRLARSVGSAEFAPCSEVRVTAEALHLRCEHPQLGTITIDGRFLVRTVTSRLDVPVVSAVVTVRGPNREVLYSARDSFEWQPDQ